MEMEGGEEYSNSPSIFLQSTVVSSFFTSVLKFYVLDFSYSVRTTTN